MQKFIAYLIAFALTLSVGASAHSAMAITADDGGSTAGSGISAPSTDDGGSTAGSGVSDSTGSTGSNGSGGSHRRSGAGGGGSNREEIKFTDVVLSHAGTNSLRIDWNTSTSTFGRIVMSTETVTDPTSDASSYFGYETGSTLEDTASESHTAIAYTAPGATYFIRLIASDGDKVFYGPEISVTPVYDSTVTGEMSMDEIGNAVDNSNGSSSAVIDISKATSTASTSNSNTNTQTASVFSAIGSSIANFFRDLWAMLFGGICKI